MSPYPDMCLMQPNEILRVCCTDYRGKAKFITYIPGIGPHGTQMVIVELIDHEDHPVIPMESARLVSLEAGEAGWSRA